MRTFKTAMGPRLVLGKLRGLYPRLKRIWADGGCAGKLVDWTRRLGGRIRAIVKRGDDAPGFEVLPKRWIVERTFGWLGRHRRMSRDDEKLTAGSEAMIHLVMINVMLHRLAPGLKRFSRTFSGGTPPDRTPVHRIGRYLPGRRCRWPCGRLEDQSGITIT